MVRWLEWEWKWEWEWEWESSVAGVDAQGAQVPRSRGDSLALRAVLKVARDGPQSANAQNGLRLACLRGSVSGEMKWTERIHGEH